MKHTRTLLAATLALTLAACGQQGQVSAPTAGTPNPTATSEGAYLVGFKENGLGAQSLSAQDLAAQAQLQAQAITAAGASSRASGRRSAPPPRGSRRGRSPASRAIPWWSTWSPTSCATRWGAGAEARTRGRAR